MSSLTAIILAAGKGSRLGNITKHTPKPLLVVGNMPLLEHVLRFVRQIDVARIIVAACYQYEKFVAAVADYNARCGQQVRVTQVGYGTLNSFAGVLADVSDGNVLVCDSDYIFSQGTLAAVKNNLAGTGMFCSFDLSGDLADVMKVKTDGTGKLVAASKTLTDFDALYTGIFTLAEQDLGDVRAIIDDQFAKYPQEEPRVEVLFKELAARGKDILVKDVGKRDWVEIDTPEDLARAREFFNGGDEKVSVCPLCGNRQLAKFYAGTDQYYSQRHIECSVCRNCSLIF